MARPAAAASSRDAGRPFGAGTKIAASASTARAAVPSPRGAHVDAVAQEARNRRPPDSGFVRSSTSSQSGSSCERAERRRARARAPSGATRARSGSASGRGRRARCRRPRRGPGSRRGSARRPPRRSLGRRDQRVDPAEQPLALGAARRIAEPVRREEGRDASALGVAQREVRERGSPGSKPWTTSKRPCASASARFARRRRARRSGCGARSAPPGPSATSSGLERRRAARARPAARSAARFDGASTVTECPSTRSSCATPATCSLTSCGCDHANGVTRQMRRPIGSSLAARSSTSYGSIEEDQSRPRAALVDL